MAEGRRREDEEEELRERRELGGPRRARSRALPGHSAAGETCGAREPGGPEGGEHPSRLSCSLARTHTLHSWRREGGTVAFPAVVSLLG